MSDHERSVAGDEDATYLYYPVDSDHVLADEEAPNQALILPANEPEPGCTWACVYAEVM